MHRIDINCDLGETEGDAGLSTDAQILAYVTSANVACGAHAGSPSRMRQLAVLCRENNVAFGAHPGYQDRSAFGRTLFPMDTLQIQQLTESQVRLALSTADGENVKLTHIKPHGALYNLAAKDIDAARAIVRGIQQCCPDLRVTGLSGSQLINAANAAGLKATNEIFADRHYLSSGDLVPRSRPDALLHDPREIAERVVAMIRTGTVTAVDGTVLVIRAETVCVHSDTDNALEIVIRLRETLSRNEIAVCSPDTIL